MDYNTLIPGYGFEPGRIERILHDWLLAPEAVTGIKSAVQAGVAQDLAMSLYGVPVVKTGHDLQRALAGLFARGVWSREELAGFFQLMDEKIAATGLDTEALEDMSAGNMTRPVFSVQEMAAVFVPDQLTQLARDLPAIYGAHLRLLRWLLGRTMQLLWYVPGMRIDPHGNGDELAQNSGTVIVALVEYTRGLRAVA